MKKKIKIQDKKNDEYTKNCFNKMSSKKINESFFTIPPRLIYYLKIRCHKKKLKLICKLILLISTIKTFY